MSNTNTDLTQVVPEKEPSSLKLVLALAIAGLLSGIILVGTYVYTDPIIKANKEAAIQKAIFRVLPNCTEYTALMSTADGLTEYVPNKDKVNDKDIELIYAGFNDKHELVGFAVPGSGAGFQDIIAVLFGYDGSNKVIIGFEVLESKETPGLGDKIFKDAEFQTNFKALSVVPEIKAVKKGEKKNTNEVQAITGATISSKAVVRLLNNTMASWQTSIDEYLLKNNLTVSEKHEQSGNIK